MRAAAIAPGDGAPDPAPRDALHAADPDDRLGDRLRLHGARRRAGPRGRPREWRRIRGGSHRLRSRGVHPRTGTPRERDRCERPLRDPGRLPRAPCPSGGPRNQCHVDSRDGRRGGHLPRGQRHGSLSEWSEGRVPRCGPPRGNRRADRSASRGRRGLGPVRAPADESTGRAPSADAISVVPGRLGLGTRGPPRGDGPGPRRGGPGDRDGPPARCVDGPTARPHAARHPRGGRLPPRRRGRDPGAPPAPPPPDPLPADRRDRPHAGGRPPRRGLRGPRPLPPGRGARANEGGPPDMIRPRAFAGLALCAFLLGATWPVLAALPSVPARVVAGDAFAITQGSGALSINVSLASNLSAANWTVTVSPEILGLSVLQGDS